MTRDWLKLRQQAANIGRPLKCPLCGFRFAFRHLIRAGKACPHCKVPIGFSFLYRALLAVAGWAVMARVAAIVVQTVIQRVFPPKLEAYSEGNTWLRLT